MFSMVVSAAVLGLAGLAAGASAQTARTRPSDQLVDVLVWGTHVETDATQYPADVRREFERHLQRSRDYRSRRPLPDLSRELAEIGYQVQVDYERKLVAVTDDPKAAALAVAYVDGAQPCYEWEGFHDCPEREAAFARAYQAAHPAGPFSAFLPLLEAHRWLCASEGYLEEKDPQGAARARQAYDRAIRTARQSKALLIRTAAEELIARGRCDIELG